MTGGWGPAPSRLRMKAGTGGRQGSSAGWGGGSGAAPRLGGHALEGQARPERGAARLGRGGGPLPEALEGSPHEPLSLLRVPGELSRRGRGRAA